MIEFSTVTREFRSLIGRRRELQTLLGSVFAGLGIFLQNTLQGGLPASMGLISRHVLAFYAIMLMVPCLILALRMARLHGGLVLNGILYARLMQEQEFRPKGDQNLAARLRIFSVSFLQFCLMDLIAGFSTSILILSMHDSMFHALSGAILIFLGWMMLYFRFHHRASRFALEKARTEACEPFTKDDWEAHISGSLEDANTGLNSDVAFVGLMVFSVFEVLTGLGKMSPEIAELTPEFVQNYGPLAYVGLMLMTTFMGLVGYLRVRVAIGKFSLLLDPTDRPFQPLRLTDSFLGYLIIAFLFTVAVHLFLGLVWADFAMNETRLLIIDGIVLALTVAAEQLMLVIAGRQHRHLTLPTLNSLKAEG